MHGGAGDPDMVSKPAERYHRSLAFLLLLVFAVLAGAGLWYMSGTADETHYLGMGRYLLKTHRWDLDDALLHPPLSYYLHSLPLIFVRLDDQAFKIPDMIQRGRVLAASAPDDRLLLLARASILLLAILLGFLVYTWASQAYGPSAGLWALFLYTFNPLILGNAALITPDLCFTFFSFLTFYLLWRYLEKPTLCLLASVGGSLGLALLSKYTGIFVALSVVIIAVFHAVRAGRRPDAEKSALRLRHLAVIFLVAIFVVDAGYFFSGTFRLLDAAAFKSRLFQQLGRTGVFPWIASLLPEAYIRGVDWQYTVLENGFGYFLMGKVSEHGWIHYYLVAFLVKSPVPLIALVALALASRKSADQGRLQYLLLVPIVLFPLYFSLTKVSRGLRYVLPIYPLLFVWLSHSAACNFGRVGSRIKLVFWALMLWYAAGTLWIAPHYLAYFNELCGGPHNGYRLLHESDFDWGQDLKGLSRYMRDRGISRIKLAYFGTADPAHYGIAYDQAPCFPEQTPENDMLVAVSATTLFFDCFARLKQLQPADKIGYTIFVYRFSRPP